MDPNACLSRIADSLLCRDLDTVRWAAYDLLAWLERGGFEPDWRRHPEAADYFNMVREIVA